MAAHLLTPDDLTAVSGGFSVAAAVRADEVQESLMRLQRVVQQMTADRDALRALAAWAAMSEHPEEVQAAAAAVMARHRPGLPS